MILTPLMPHQQEAFDYLKEHDPCMLAMFPGSGKSLTVLTYAEHLKAKRILITSDKTNTINTWPDEIYNHTNYDVMVRPTLEQLRRIEANPDVPVCVVVNYDYLSHHKLDYTRPWDLWIGDELGEVKDQRTDKHVAMSFIQRTIPHKVGLNGELMTERMEDIWGQMSLLDGNKYLGHYLTQFRNKFMQPDSRGYGWLPKRSAFTMVQKAMKNISYWLPDNGTVVMPHKHYHIVKVPMSDEQLSLDIGLKNMFAASLRGVNVETNHAAVVYQKRIQLCGGILRGDGDAYTTVETEKIAVVRKVITNNPSSKIVVWHTYIPETKLLQNSLKDLPVHVYTFADPTDTDALEEFSKVEGQCVLLIRTSMCKGLNQLANADIAVYYSNPLSYARRAQSEGRTRRVTTTNLTTHYIDIITEGGADAQVLNLLTHKKSCSFSLTSLRELLDSAIV